MLTELTIDNFAVIERLLLQLEPGFTVLTGETGAGKSIIIDALQSALGARLPPDVVRAGAPSAAIEAIFDLSEPDGESGLSSLLEEYGIEDEGCLILRREVSAAGKSSARVNGRSVPLSVLAAFGSLLVDIHGQSDHLAILKRDRQLDVLDRFGDLLSVRSEVAEAVRDLARRRRELADLTAGQRDMEQRLDLLRFQVQEIDAAQLTAQEEGDLEAERNLLVNAERLTALAGTAYESLQGETGAALEGVGDAASAARELAAIDPSLDPLFQRLQTAQYELEDVARELRQYRDGVEYDPARLDSVEERLDVLNRLKRKYGPTIEEVMAFGERARSEMEDVENLDDRLAALEREVRTAEEFAGALADRLSAGRRDAATRLTEVMRDALQGLGLKDTAFKVEVTQTESDDGLALPDGRRVSYTPSGVDQVSFSVSFNPGEPLRPLERVASGGETSRFLLALKSVLAEADRTPTLVFDEVDVGVGGRGAGNVGERMRRLATTHQVISITHLPQIAALADHHLTVEKVIAQGRTSVDVRQLEGGDRIGEIAAMMSGSGTEAARRNAEELLLAARRER